MTPAELRVWLIIGLLTVLVIILRNLFLFAPRSWQPRGLMREALRYAPIAALAALLAPEILAGWRLGEVTGAAALADPRFASALVLIIVIRLSGNAFVGIAAGIGVFFLLSA